MPIPQTSDIQRRVLSVLQQGMPITPTPYKDMAEKADLTTEELIREIKNLKDERKLRRIGAVLNHLAAGLPSGALVAWKSPPEKTELLGNLFASFSGVSHVYERTAPEKWPYNLYTMVHAPDDEMLADTIARMARDAGLKNFRLLPTERELKKTPPVYITEK